MNKGINIDSICQIGKEVIETELSQVAKLTDRIDNQFAQACNILLNCKGHVIVIGMGKSGHIANKIAATLASTGTPAFCVHPAEASHGDLGMITENDVALPISKSGNTPEILAILPLIKRLNIPLISITGNPNSALAKSAAVNLDISVDQEACPLGLAPTASTTSSLVMGDALAIALLKTKGFTKQDFAFSHPGGNLGKRLLLKIDDIMRTGASIPKIGPEECVKAALLEMTAKTLGMTTVVGDNGKLIGIFTDGDLRRTLDRELNFHTTKIIGVMTQGCKTIQSGSLAFDALTLMEKHKITSLVVVDTEETVAGIIHIHDILQAGINS